MSSVGWKARFRNIRHYVRRQRLVTDLVAIDSAKNDRSAWKNRSSMLEQKIERRTHDSDHCIDFSAAVLRVG